jgi:glyoxylase-like metal-dependent hydrolase (beta-lactamase superfamily II)
MVDRSGSGWVETVVAENPSPLTLEGTRTYVVGPSPCLVIDPGPDLADHLDNVEIAIGSADVAAICVTHHHADHAAGAAELRLRLAAPLAANPRSAELAGLDPPELPLSAGSTVPFGGGCVEAVPAPGHCADHVGYYWPQATTLFSGDMVLGEGTSVIAPPEGDMTAYIASLRRLARFDLTLIYPGHGPRIDDPARLIDQYIRHRLDREAQILAALAAGADTPAQIRARVYGELDPRLHRAAEGSVAAHLAKLVSEGRVRRLDDRYRPRA